MHKRWGKHIFCAFVALIFIFAGLSVFAQSEEKTYIVEFKNGISLFGLENHRLNVLTESQLKECIEEGIVDWYEEDYEVTLFDSSEIALMWDSGYKWDLDVINAEGSREIGGLGQGVRVAVIDSGTNLHPDLVENICEGYNYITKTTDVYDNIGHGTFVSGIIATKPNRWGIEGVAPEVKIVPLQCFDTGVKTTISMIYDAIIGAVDEFRCDIINMSFGLVQDSETLKKAIDYAEEAGVCLVAAVGNDGNEVLSYPAAYDNVIGVGSVNSNLEKSDFSQHNKSVYVVAPGENVAGPDMTGGYSWGNGTSFAAPQVSGMLAIMMNINPDLANSDAMRILRETVTDLGDEGYDTDCGYGLVNVKAATEYMLKGFRYFISPIITGYDKSSVTVLNNTENELNGICLWANYEGKLLAELSYDDIYVEPRKTVKTECTFVEDRIKCMLWNSIQDITPITNFQEK